MTPRTNVLIVDDQPENLLTLEAVLEPLGQNLVRAESGEAALRRLLQDDFALILLDIQMPGLDGFETAELIKARPRTRNIPIIFLTAINKELRHIHRGYETGGVDYLFKPFDPVVLRSKVAVFLDLHDKTEALRLSEERLRLLVEHVEDHAVIWCDADARVATWNAGAERITGLREPEILGEPFARLYPPESSGRHDPAGHLAIARARGMWHEPEGLRTRADGRFYWASTTVTAVQGSGGELVGYSVLVQDVTERRRTDIALRNRAEALEQINHDLEQFVAVLSEDLGEPLGSIAGSVRELQAADELGDAARKLVDGIGAETEGMRARIEDLLRYSRVAQDELQRAPVDCAAVVERALADLAEQGRSPGASIEVGPLPTVDADEELLSLVFANLLDNALRYADPELGARVTVHAEADAGLWLFRVSDEGIGLDYGDVERVFELFERVHPDAYPGSGIGLTICRRIVERHGGRIWAEPQPEGGTSFVFTLPSAEPA
jgi:hypothetical protein